MNVWCRVLSALNRTVFGSRSGCEGVSSGHPSFASPWPACRSMQTPWSKEGCPNRNTATTPPIWGSQTLHCGANLAFRFTVQNHQCGPYLHTWSFWVLFLCWTRCRVPSSRFMCAVLAVMAGSEEMRQHFGFEHWTARLCNLCFSPNSVDTPRGSYGRCKAAVLRSVCRAGVCG